MNWIIPYNGFNEADLVMMDDQSIQRQLLQMNYRDIKRLINQYDLKVCDQDFWARRIFIDQYCDDLVTHNGWRSIYEYLTFNFKYPKKTISFPDFMKNASIDILKYTLIHMNDDDFYSLYDTNQFVKDFCIIHDIWGLKLEKNFSTLEAVFVALDEIDYHREPLNITDLVDGKKISLQRSSYSLHLDPNDFVDDQILDMMYEYKVCNQYHVFGNLHLNTQTGAIVKYIVDERSKFSNTDCEDLMEIFNKFFV